ncbi:MAG: chaperone modulator CbpM [Flavobacteriales bacterium]|jgi:chaperone modulatory protein CbpM|nr:MerR family transcriptional regulator [Flavobacteriales bacterium]
METEELIAMQIYCDKEGLEASFVEALHERGLIRITTIKEQRYVEPEYLPHIEKLARMHYDLQINLEGIEAISHMLERMETMQQEMRVLQQRLGIYE